MPTTLPMPGIFSVYLFNYNPGTLEEAEDTGIPAGAGPRSAIPSRPLRALLFPFHAQHQKCPQRKVKSSVDFLSSEQILQI